MNEVPRPRRLPKSVYVRRRIAVLLGLIAVAAVTVTLIVGPARVVAWFTGGSNETEPPVSTQELPDESDEASNAPSSEQEVPDEEGSADEPEENDPDADATPVVAECSPSVIAVEAVTDATEYASDALPKFSLRVTNHAPTECDIDLGTKTMAFTVRSGAELYWDSRDCQVNGESFPVRMQPGQTIESEPLAWERIRSNPETCDDDRPTVPAGGASYHLGAEIGGVESTRTRQFILY